MTDARMSALLGQMAALVDLMHVDGRECFDSLSEASRAEIRDVFDRLSGELQALTAGLTQHRTATRD